MKNSILKLFIISLIIFSCNNENVITPIETTAPLPVVTTKIMPLGASRVEGDRPNYESYRYELWKLLIDGNWNFDYVGTQSDNSEYPTYSGLNFDTDHEGRGGWTAELILSQIENWLNELEDMPDIVLFSSPGGNDALGGGDYGTILSNVNSIIDIIQQANPNVTIIIEKLAPANSIIMVPPLTDYFDSWGEDVVTLAQQQSTSTSQVITVDMYTGFNDSYLADVLHYNQSGAEFIANRYYDVLIDILN